VGRLLGAGAGLGYEDCSTRTVNISRAELAANRTFQLEHQQLQTDE